MNPPLLIVGGGPAGAAAAIGLARAGERPLLIERSRETADALCGGFLSWRTLETLAGLGVEADTLNPIATTRVRLFAGSRQTEARLPRPARSVSRRKLDTVLLAAAGAAGARIERGVAVRAIEDAVRLDDGSELRPDALFLASGKHDVRGLARPAEARGSDPTLGLRVRIAAAPGLARLIGDAIELHLFDRGYCGIALQEDGSANVCMAVHRSRLNEAGDPERLLAALGEECPALGERLAWRDGSEPIDAIANVPYGWRLREGRAGLFRLGDQAGVIPSLAGEGMGIALASGVSATEAWRRGGAGAAADWQSRFAYQIELPIGVARMIAGLGERPTSAGALVTVARLVPSLVDLAARMTRVGG
ncbi:NAD(P)/FAD-dependent oxidoreductase [Novosphingobium sp. Gsoil 351]|uniref:NAD(P)/FAD-dependent oxidoreductase n=1 Tax=Novosphingobium sp. Gsoil 351 TaxID=2675225 RepID=UPI001E29F390|nr:FAD-dependent monooxygenase [Novosphingobium sp. Gsoil 351]